MSLEGSNLEPVSAEDSSETLVIDGHEVAMDEKITIPYDGVLIEGTVSAIESADGDDYLKEITISDISAPEEYINTSGVFIYNEHTKRWSVKN